jgi:hypothetical protein
MNKVTEIIMKYAGKSELDDICFEFAVAKTYEMYVKHFLHEQIEVQGILEQIYAENFIEEQ